MSRSPGRPNLFIVGQPKSGSTALHQFLSEHPDVFMSPYKEPSYFCPDLHEESDAYHRKRVHFPIRTPEQYAALFEGVSDESVVGESSVNYLFSKTAADEIAAFDSTAKIIIILRNPVDYLFSFYLMNARRSWEPATSFAEALSLEETRERGVLIPPNVNFPSTLLYAQRARYREQIERFLARFSPEQIKVLVYEEFKRDNAALYRETLEFIGVDPAFRPEFRHVNPTGEVRYPRLNAMLRHRTVIRLGYLLVPPSRHRWIQQNILNKLVSHEREAPKVEAGLREELMRQLAPEVARTSELLGIDLAEKWAY
jgi:hypothetical protein